MSVCAADIDGQTNTNDLRLTLMNVKSSREGQAGSRGLRSKAMRRRCSVFSMGETHKAVSMQQHRVLSTVNGSQFVVLVQRVLIIPFGGR